MLKTPNRRLRTLARTALIMCILFLATLLVCIIVFVLSSSVGVKILSPITHASANQQSSDVAINMIKAFCQNNHISCQSITPIDDDTLQITLDSGGIVFLSTKKDLGQQLASLQRIVEQLTIKGKQFKKLDFRFDNIIVSF